MDRECKTEGHYVAVVSGIDGKLRAVWFVFPREYADGKYDAGWYYLNVLDKTNVLEAVYPAALFEKITK